MIAKILEKSNFRAFGCSIVVMYSLACPNLEFIGNKSASPEGLADLFISTSYSTKPFSMKPGLSW
jgi:hypothetical protein